MSTYYQLRCDSCDQQGGFFSRQAWGWGNADLIENHKFLMHHAECPTLRVLREFDDEYGDKAAEKRWDDAIGDPESIAHHAWPHGEWKAVAGVIGQGKSWRDVWNEGNTSSKYKYPPVAGDTKGTATMSAEPWQVHEFSEPVIHRGDDGVHRVEWQHRGRTLQTVVADEIVEQFASMATELERLRSIVSDLAAEQFSRISPCPLCGEWDPHDPGCPWLRATQEQKP